MKRIGKEPRLLSNVMEAIANLKEKAGSTQKRIIDHVSHVLKRNKDSSRNVTMQIRRALDHGLNSGLIKHRSGKYVLGLDKKDFAVFKRFRKVSDPLSGIVEARRRRRRGGRRRRRSRRRRRGRRHTEANDKDEYSDNPSDSEDDKSMLGTPEPMDRGRRRRRRGGRRRRRRSGRRRGRRRRHAVSSEVSDSAVSPTKKSSEELRKVEKRRSSEDYQKPPTQGGSARDYQDRQSRNQPRDSDMNECGNPECLCSIKQEEDPHNSRYMSHDNNSGYYNDDYML